MASLPELLHRGSLTVTYPAPDLWEQLGKEEGVTALIADLYYRMERDSILREAFFHFNAPAATPFFIQWFGGERAYSDQLTGGLARRHHDRYISPTAASRWLRCMREALEARSVEAAPVLRPLAQLAAALVNSPDTAGAGLRRSCEGVQYSRQVTLQTLLLDVSRGRSEAIREALQRDPLLASARGKHGQTLAWAAVYRNRSAILALALEAGGDPNAPGCDPTDVTMACDVQRLGTGLSVTPLALARKLRPALVAPLLEHGAREDLFTAAWLGDLAALRDWLDAYPELVNALDPAEDFQEATPLAHAVFSGSFECVRLLLERGAEVVRHSGKLLTLAVIADRADLVELLIQHGADVQRVDLYGRLDDAERPVADLLFRHGKRPPAWMLSRACRPEVSRNELHRVRALLEYGSHPEDRDRHGHTALHYAVRGGKPPLIQLLLDSGADPDARDHAGLTPLLHLAKTRARFDPLPVLELLVARSADVDAWDEQGATLLMQYARQGAAEPVRWLLAHGADPLIADRRGRTVFHFASRHPQVVAALFPG